MKQQVQWPTALVVSVAIVALVVMAALEVDTSDVMFVIVLVLGGVGATQLAALREQTNGNTTEQLRMLRAQQTEQAALIRTMAERLAAAPPVPPPPTAGSVTTTVTTSTDAALPEQVHPHTYTYP